MSEQSKVERWMIDAAKGIDANVSTYLGFLSAHPTETVINELAQIISRHAPAPNAESEAAPGYGHTLAEVFAEIRELAEDWRGKKLGTCADELERKGTYILET